MTNKPSRDSISDEDWQREQRILSDQRLKSAYGRPITSEHESNQLKQDLADFYRRHYGEQRRTTGEELKRLGY